MLKNREELIAYRQTAAKAYVAQSKKIIVCAEAITCRPADLLEPELDRLRAEIAPYIEQDEDVLSYALFEQVAMKFFERRKNERFGLDAKNGDAKNGVHVC